MLNREVFEKLVQEGFLAIPEKFRTKVRNVAVIVEDEPSEELRRKEHLPRNVTLLGYYQGIPATARGEGYGVGPTFPDTIFIFQKPIEEAAGGDMVRLRKIVEDTLWHEIAHYFGMDEGMVRAKEKKRKGRQTL